MTNETTPNVPRQLLERAVRIPTKASVEENHALLSTPSPAGVDGLEMETFLHTLHMELGQTEQFCSKWKGDPFGIAGEDYSSTYSVTSEPLCRLSDAQTIIDGLRGEVEQLGNELAETELRALKFYHQIGAHVDLYRELRTERDQQAQRIGELEGLLRSCLPALSDCGCAALANRIDDALSAVYAAAPNIAPTSEHSSQPECTKVAELVELVRSKFPRIDPCQPVPLDEKAHCCEYTIYVERERLHRLIDAKLASLEVINLDYLPDDVVANAQNVRGYLIPSGGLTPLQLSLRYPDGHPNFTEKMWQSRSMNCTSSGYWDWLHLKLRYES